MRKYEIPYISMIVRTFSERFGMPLGKAFSYLQRYGGLAFLIEYYDVEHLQDNEETVDDLIVKCRQNGGPLA